MGVWPWLNLSGLSADELWRQRSFSKTAEQEIESMYHAVGFNQSFICVCWSSQNSLWSRSLDAMQVGPFGWVGGCLRGGGSTEHRFRINVLIMTGMNFGAVCMRQLFLTQGRQCWQKHAKPFNLLWEEKKHGIIPEVLIYCKKILYVRHWMMHEDDAFWWGGETKREYPPIDMR